ncbi:Uncharacterised protein [Acinetobacter baumannii]|nr:Uncharacterised protein [Acinetobacter baumannii]
MGAMGDNASPVSHLVRQAVSQGSDPFSRREKGSDPRAAAVSFDVQGLT